MIVQTIAELAQSYIAQARSSGRLRPSASRARCSQGFAESSARDPRRLRPALRHSSTISGPEHDARGDRTDATGHLCSPGRVRHRPLRQGRSICTRKPPSLTRADSRSTTSKLERLTLAMESSSSQPRVSRRDRGQHVHVSFSKACPGWRSGPLDCQSARFLRRRTESRHPDQQDCQ